MSPQIQDWIGSDLNTGRAVIKAAADSRRDLVRKRLTSPARAFLTIDWEPWSDIQPLLLKLPQLLHQFPGGDWTAWDHNLFDKLPDCIIDEQISAIEHERPEWVAQLWSHLSWVARPRSEIEWHRCIGLTIGALAMAGHTVIFGHGAHLITRGMRGGIHIQLVAPAEYRVHKLAEELSITPHEARYQIYSLEQSRTGFYTTWWQCPLVGADAFTMSFNTADSSVAEMVDCIGHLIRGRDEASLSNVRKLASSIDCRTSDRPTRGNALATATK